MNNKFKDYSLGFKIRTLISQSILSHIKDPKNIQASELQIILTSVFKYREYEVSYQKMKILCYGKNKYISITLEQYIDYITQKHLGQNSINHFTYNNGYLLKNDKVMNKYQFVETLALGLQFIDGQLLRQFKGEFSVIFDGLNIDKNGNLSFQEYQQFLIYYFGHLSPMSINPTTKIVELSESEQLISSQKHINILSNGQLSSILFVNPSKLTQSHNGSPHLMLSNQQVNAHSLLNMKSIPKLQSSLDEFHDLITTQINNKSQIYDKDGDGYLFRKQFQTFLYDILELQYNSINFISKNYFNSSKKQKIVLKQFCQIVCEIHFKEIFTNLIKSQLKQTLSHRCIMTLTYFIDRITENCFFFSNKPSYRLLEKVFEELIAKSQNTNRLQINLQDFNSFILRYCCNNKLKLRYPSSKPNKNLRNAPVSIAEVQNSHYESDESERSDLASDNNINNKLKEQINSRRSKSFKQISNQNSRLQFQLHNSQNLQEQSKDQQVDQKLSEERCHYIADNIYTKMNYQGQKLELFKEEKQQFSIKQENKTQQKIYQNEQVMVQEQKKLNFTKMQAQPMHKQQFKFKQRLWSKLQDIVMRYSFKNIGFLSRQQFQSLHQKQYIFINKSTFITNIQKIYKRQSFLSLQMIVKYYIHFTGEEALINFNKNQIKGKSSITALQTSQILSSAFNSVVKARKQAYCQYVEAELMKEAVNGWHYKDYLQYIGRNLSIKQGF